jgi:uridine kinase
VRLVGIGGGTASGKTTLARRLVALLPDAVLIGHERYYRDFEDPSRQNYDAPDSLESELLAFHLDELLASRPVDLPFYDFSRHRRREEHERIHPARFVVVEGILVLCEPLLAGRFHFKAFVEADDDVRLIRRIRRDVVERGRSVDSVLEQYERTVRPSHLRWVRRQRELADIVLDGEACVDAEARRLAEALLAMDRRSTPLPSSSG